MPKAIKGFPQESVRVTTCQVLQILEILLSLVCHLRHLSAAIADASILQAVE